MRNKGTNDTLARAGYAGRIWGVVTWTIFSLVACTAKMQSQYILGLLCLSAIFLGVVVLLWRYFSVTRRRRNVYARILGYVLFGAGSLFLACTPVGLQLNHKEVFVVGFLGALVLCKVNF